LFSYIIIINVTIPTKTRSIRCIVLFYRVLL